MHVINLTDFERQGNIEQDTHFSNLEEIASALDQVTASASRSIRIYTPDMEPVIYNNEKLAENLLTMVRDHRHAQIQILASETSTAIQRGHILLRLTQQLTSSMEIRITPDEYQDNKLSFLVADNNAFIYRPDIKNFNGIYNADCKFRAQKLNEIFTGIWEHAVQDPQTRALSI